MTELVTAVIPAFNAAATLDETLRSVRAQSWPALEILVVDDGSADETPALVQRHAAVDPRVRLLRQANGGVATARNHGIREARGAFVAPVDADDLWHPAKIERQMQAILPRPEVALVYTWFAQIDDQSRVIAARYRPRAEGRIFVDLCRGNLIGNGSSPLMRRDAVLAAGGYDASLRARRAQGCEDYRLYLALAERHAVALVPEFLTGYRQSAAAMSGDLMQMLRSFDLVTEEVRQRHPERAADLHLARCDFLRWSFERACGFSRWRAATGFAAELLREEWLAGARALLRVPAAVAWRSTARPALHALLGQARQARRPPFLRDCPLPVAP